MPHYTDHLFQARWNQDFLNKLIQNNSRFLDWIITVSYYVALHYIDYILSQKLNFHPDSHIERGTKLNSSNFKRKTIRQYIKLYEASRRSRYNPIYNRKLKLPTAKRYADIVITDFVNKFPNI